MFSHRCIRTNYLMNKKINKTYKIGCSLNSYVQRMFEFNLVKLTINVNGNRIDIDDYKQFMDYYDKCSITPVHATILMEDNPIDIMIDYNSNIISFMCDNSMDINTIVNTLFA